MILVDTSVWIDHFRDTNHDLGARLETNQVATHPMVIGELACRHFKARREIFQLLDGLPTAPEATHVEARNFIERQQLMGSGIVFIDVHLLASTALMADARLWTRDKRLASAAKALDLAYA